MIMSSRRSKCRDELPAFDSMAAGNIVNNCNNSDSNNSTNPIIIARIILRKAITLVFRDHNFIIRNLKDIIIGITFGAITVTILIALDYRGIINVESARTLRKVASKVINDPLVIANLEKELDVKIIKIERYNTIEQELKVANTNMTIMEKKMEYYTKDLKEKLKELESVKKEYDTLYNKIQTLDWKQIFCGECIYGHMHGGEKKQTTTTTTCDKRVAFLLEKYDKWSIDAKYLIMQDFTCKRSDSRVGGRCYTQVCLIQFYKLN